MKFPVYHASCMETPTWSTFIISLGGSKHVNIFKVQGSNSSILDRMTLKVESPSCPKTSITMYQSTQCNTAEDLNLHCCDVNSRTSRFWKETFKEKPIWNWNYTCIFIVSYCKSGSVVWILVIQKRTDDWLSWRWFLREIILT